MSAIGSPDFPMLRQQAHCPVCRQPKSVGTVICWTCNGRLKEQYDGGWGPIEAKLLVLEARAVDDAQLD